ncbi:MAG TPA: 3-hydroxyacyl-CoA dehydrogenase NAD-binding domain-containing protein, partial [Ignavibacteriaceae bacterium]|nr:3-hydroxyacyl-CoA dehydrogenase NAD-binding domain-containing protein [Ignavibacteriaceae bacterium]
MENEKLKLEDLLERRNQYEEGVINNIAIIGAGLMGQGIAQTIAASGLEVLLIEKDNKHLERAKDVLSSSIDREHLL